MSRRTYWRAVSLDIENEPLLWTLLKYRQKKNRVRTPKSFFGDRPGGNANLISSITDDGQQMPILDLDFPHHFEPSTTPGHHHLYFDIPMAKWRWFILMTGLVIAGVIEKPFYAWSIRRGGNFVRIPGGAKVTDAETQHSDYGWLFRVRHHG